MDRKDVYAASTVILVGISSFFLGKLSILEKNRAPVVIEQFSFEVSNVTTRQDVEKTSFAAFQAPVPASNQAASPIGAGTGVLVGSKGSNKYHLPTCAGAQKISEANKVWFSSKTEAERAGYVPAANCKGI